MNTRIAIVASASLTPDTPEGQMGGRICFRLPLQNRINTSRYKKYSGYAALIEDTSRYFPFKMTKQERDSADPVQLISLKVCLDMIAEYENRGKKLDQIRTAVVVANTMTGEVTRSRFLGSRADFLEKVHRAAGNSLPCEQDKEALQHMTPIVRKIWDANFDPVNEDSLPGGLANVTAGRTSSSLGYQGGAFLTDAACSSGLTALHNGARILSCGEAREVLVVAADISMDPFEIDGFESNGVLSSSQPRAFDRKATGFWPGEGVVAFLIKKLEDAEKDGDDIIGIVHGFGMSSDGVPGSVTAPHHEGQILAYKRALGAAGMTTHDISAYMCHGTGTFVGDIEEATGLVELQRSFNDTSRKPIMTTKTHSGHCKAASSLVALETLLFALNCGKTVPMVCKDPLEQFDEWNRLVYPSITVQNLRGDVALCSTFGFGGHNESIVVQGTKKTDPPKHVLNYPRHESELLLFSAPTADLLKQQLEELTGAVKHLSQAELADLSEHLVHRIRNSAPEADSNDIFRLVVLAESPTQAASVMEQAVEILSSSTSSPELLRIAEGGGILSVGKKNVPPRIGFVFPGQGSQFVQQNASLYYRYPCCQKLESRAQEFLNQIHGDSAPRLSELLRPVLEKTTAKELAELRSQLASTAAAQMAVTLGHLSMLRLLRSWNISADHVAGHSLGELSAMFSAGWITDDQLLEIVAQRGKAMADNPGKKGKMIVIASDLEQVSRRIAGKTGLSVACLNGPQQVVVSGERSAVVDLKAELDESDIKSKILNSSDAFHSSKMSASAKAFLKDWTLAGSIPVSGPLFHSSVEGAFDSERIRLDLVAHLQKQMVSPVDFTSVMNVMAKECDVVLEVGPGSVLTDLMASQKERPSHLLRLNCDGDGFRSVNAALGTLFVLGVDLNLANLHEGRLTRPFVDPRSVPRISNPCEGPLREPAAEKKRDELDSPTVAPNDEGLMQILHQCIVEINRADVQIKTSDVLKNDLNLQSVKVRNLSALMAERGIPTKKHLTGDETIGEVLAMVKAGLNSSVGNSETADIWTRSFAVVAEDAPLTFRAAKTPLLARLRGVDFDLTEKLERLLITGTSEAALAVAVVDADGSYSYKEVIKELKESLVSAKSGTLCIFTTSRHHNDRKDYLEITPSVSALAATYHLENANITVRVVEVRHEACEFLPEIISEEIRDISASSVRWSHIIRDGRKRLRPAFQHVTIPRNSTPALTADDRVLITGGAGGLGIVLAERIGLEIGANVHLIGSSAPNDRIEDVLRQLRNKGVKSVEYRRCDVTDDDQVKDLVQRGDYTAVIHGAARQEFCDVAALDVCRAADVAAPKVVGLLNVLKHVDSSRVRVVCAITSLIGFCGMPQTGGYALANETAGEVLRKYSNAHPSVKVFGLAYGVWKLGIGARDNVAENLAAMGMAAIPTADGLEHFMNALHGQLPISGPSFRPEIVTFARVTSMLDTMSFASAQEPPPQSLFPSKIRRRIPGVEGDYLIFLPKDGFLDDHVYEGTRLIPLAVVMEIMAWAARTTVPHRKDFKVVSVSDVIIRHPIIVGNNTQIAVTVIMNEAEDNAKVTLRNLSEFRMEASFSAVLKLSDVPEIPAPLRLPDLGPDFEQRKLHIPSRDTYGSILFHGPSFRVIDRICNVNISDDLSEGNVTVELADRRENPVLAEVLSRCTLRSLFIGDGILQAPQIPLPGRTHLPDAIGEIKFFRVNPDPNGRCTLQMQINRTGDSGYICCGNVFAPDGVTLLETISGYKVVEVKSSKPTELSLGDLLSPEAFDAAALATFVASVNKEYTLDQNCYDLKIIRGTTNDRQARHELVRKHFPDVEYLPDKKGAPSSCTRLVSVSHDMDSGFTIIATSSEAIGVDIVRHDTAAPFIRLAPLPSHLEDLKIVEDKIAVHPKRTRNEAALRSHAIFESLLKLCGGLEEMRELKVVRLRPHLNSDIDALECSLNGQRVFCFVASVRLALGPKRFLSVALKNVKEAKSERFDEMMQIFDQRVPNRKDIETFQKTIKSAAAEVAPEFPQFVYLFNVIEMNGRSVLMRQFPLTYNDITAGENVSESQFVRWMGQLRDLGLLGESHLIQKKTHLYTDSYKLMICGRLCLTDVVVQHLWMSEFFNVGSTVNVWTAFYKIGRGGILHRVAIGVIQATMFKGDTPEADMPEAFSAGQFTIAGTEGRAGETFHLPESEEALAERRRELGLASSAEFSGQKLLSSVIPPKDRTPHFSRRIEATGSESNVFGNIYFATYATWARDTIDAYMRKQNMNVQEWMCLDNEIEHSQELVPGDKVRVDLIVTKEREVLKFEIIIYRCDGSLVDSTDLTIAAVGRQLWALIQSPIAAQ